MLFRVTRCKNSFDKDILRPNSQPRIGVLCQNAMETWCSGRSFDCNKFGQRHFMRASLPCSKWHFRLCSEIFEAVHMQIVMFCQRYSQLRHSPLKERERKRAGVCMCMRARPSIHFCLRASTSKRYRYLSAINLATGMQWKCRIRTNGHYSVVIVVYLLLPRKKQWLCAIFFFFLHHTICESNLCDVFLLLVDSFWCAFHSIRFVVGFCYLSFSIIIIVCRVFWWLWLWFVGRLVRSPWKHLSLHTDAYISVWAGDWMFVLLLFAKCESKNGRHFKW